MTKIPNQRLEPFNPSSFDIFESRPFGREIHNPVYSPQKADSGLQVIFRQTSVTDNMDTQEHYMSSSKSLSRLEFWLGMVATLVGVLAIAIGAAWTISNSINEKVSSARQELAGNILTSKNEVSTRLDRIEDKMDASNKEITSSLFKIQASLEAQQNNSKKQN